MAGIGSAPDHMQQYETANTTLLSKLFVPAFDRRTASKASVGVVSHPCQALTLWLGHGGADSRTWPRLRGCGGGGRHSWAGPSAFIGASACGGAAGAVAHICHRHLFAGCLAAARSTSIVTGSGGMVSLPCCCVVVPGDTLHDTLAHGEAVLSGVELLAFNHQYAQHAPPKLTCWDMSHHSRHRLAHTERGRCTLQ